jgi:hypothetical protein
VPRLRLERYDRTSDPQEKSTQLVAEPIDYAEVRRRYYCRRYQNAFVPQARE